MAKLLKIIFVLLISILLASCRITIHQNVINNLWEVQDDTKI